MDAVKFINEKERMCHSIPCHDCGLAYDNNGYKMSCSGFIADHPEEAVKIVEQWGKGRPVETRQSEFLKHYPDAMTDRNTGVLAVCPRAVFGGQCKYSEVNCGTCCEKFWLEPV